MKKINLIAFSAFIIAIGLQLVVVYAYHFNQKKVISYYQLHGRESEAKITELRQYFPSQGVEKYGRIYYEYLTPSGRVYKGSTWLSKDRYNQLIGKNETRILFDPSKPNCSILKIEVERRINKEKVPLPDVISTNRVVAGECGGLCRRS